MHYLLLAILLQSPSGERDDTVSLKRDADGWHAVRRGDGGVIDRQPTAGPPERPIAPDLSPPATPALLSPYVAFPIGSWPEAVALGDLNGDTRQDVVVATGYYFDPANDNSIHVFLQDEDGSLVKSWIHAVGGQPDTVQVGDVNGDHRDDVVVGNGLAIVVFAQNDAGTLDPAVTYPTPNSYKVAIGDLNGDGRLDVVGIDWGSSGHDVEVFLQNLIGALVPAATYTVDHGGYDDLDVGDVSGDGRDDVVVMSGQLYAHDNLGVLVQTPGGLLDGPFYYDLGLDENTRGVGIGDVTGDARGDVVVSYGGNRPRSHIAVFGQTPEGILGAPAASTSYDIPEPVEIVDVTGDGLRDVVVLHGGWRRLGVFEQQPGGGLGPEQLFEIPYASHYNPHGLTAGDLNGDGATDVAIADYNHGLVVLYGIPTLRAPVTERDFDGDGRSDLAIYGANTGWWHGILSTTGELVSVPFGGGGHWPVPADYDGDRRADLAIRGFRSLQFYSSRAEILLELWLGRPEDEHVPADYDGDGLADLALYRDDGTWVVRASRTDRRLFYRLGGAGETPLPADYDGDGRADPAVLDYLGWKILHSGDAEVREVSLPPGAWTPLRGDFDADGRHDPAAYEGSTGRWKIWLSSTEALTSFTWGGPSFQAVGGGDYDGDGATELVLHQQTTGLWFIYLTTTQQVVSGRFGGSGYAPVE